MIHESSDPQEVFDFVANHLFTQGKQAIVKDADGDTHCQYRGEFGSSCAVGCMIPDDKYVVDMETRAVSHPKIADVFPNYFTLRLVLNDLQEVHDDPLNWNNTSCMHSVLIDVAINQGLNFDKVATMEFADR